MVSVLAKLVYAADAVIKLTLIMLLLFLQCENLNMMLNIFQLTMDKHTSHYMW